MHILMASARYAPLIGGIETHIREVGTRMAARGHTVTVLTTDPTGALPATEYDRGMAIRRVKAWPKNRDYYFAPGVYSEIGSRRYNIVHVQGYSTFVAPIAMMAAIRSSIPFVLTFHSGGHSSGFRNSIRGIQRQILAPLVRRADHLVGVSRFEADFFAQSMGLDRAKFSVIPNGAELPTPSDPPPDKEPHLVLSVGRLEKYKGHHRVIEAFPRLLQSVPDARLKIIGSGPYEQALHDLVQRLGLHEVVTIESIPSAERQRLADLLYSAGVVVLLSEYEAHPVSVMEALSMGCPVLVADTSGLSEIAQDGLCRAIPLNTPSDGVAAAIERELVTDSRSQGGIKLTNWDDCTDQLLVVYKNILTRKALPIASLVAA